MVNERQRGSKSPLLLILRDSPEPLSGDALGKMLGISRVAVHKQIQSLIALGYPVRSSRHGYSLGQEVNMPLSSWEFRPEEKITVLEEIPSTMDEARRLAEKNPGEDFTIAAETQSSGRGRRNRVWESPEGGLWATHVIHPGGSSLRLQRFVLAGTAVLARILKESWNIDARVKWPNDVLVDGRKIAGILGESRIIGDRIDYLALGLGMNVNNPTSPDAAALKDITGKEADRRALLRAWVASLDSFLKSADFSADLSGDDTPAWWNSLMPPGERKISGYTGGRKVEGIIKEVDGLGRLVIQIPGGSILRLSPGDMDDKWSQT